MIHKNDSNIAFRFEGLVRTVFGNVDKYGDPWGYAAQDHFLQFMEEPPSEYAKRALSTVLIKMIIDHKGDKQLIERLRELENAVWKLKNQVESIELIDAIIKMAESLKY